MEYVFKFRRKFFWKSHKVIGHHYDQGQDKMVLHYQDGSIQEVASWKSCEVKLGQDWCLAMKRQLEQQAGQPIQLAVGN
jgi:hypothetical protein